MVVVGNIEGLCKGDSGSWPFLADTGDHVGNIKDSCNSNYACQYLS